jgi:hypothetical protein
MAAIPYTVDSHRHATLQGTRQFYDDPLYKLDATAFFQTVRITRESVGTVASGRAFEYRQHIRNRIGQPVPKLGQAV